MMMQDEIEW